MTGRLKGKTAFVTGGSRGIGKAIARALAREGANITFTFNSEPVPHDPAWLSLRMEVTDRSSVDAAFRAALEKFGELHILVNNAGINKPTDFDQITTADWDQILSVNLKGPFNCSQAALPYLRESGGGSIIHIGSVSGQYGGPRTAHYAASKAGLISLAQVIARFGAKWNIRSNVIAAGLIESEMASGGLAAPSVAKIADNILLRRLGTATEVADAAVFLASDASSYITAQTINVNGGLYF